MAPPPSSTNPFNISLTDPKARVQAYLDKYKTEHSYAVGKRYRIRVVGVYANENQGYFDALLMQSLRVVTARAKGSPKDDFEAIVVFEIEAVPGLCNPIQRMHGGAVSLLADMTTTMATAPIASEGFWEFGGVTRTLNITMLQPIPRGAELLVECKLKSIGKRLCRFAGGHLDCFEANFTPSGDSM